MQMKNYSFRILNVFAESTFGGNPLCVFENGEGLSDEDMLAIALQFNLSETVFLLPSNKATARMRIFTTGYEMPFAGHPTLGTAHVVRDLLKTANNITLECKAGIVPVEAKDNLWTLTAPTQGEPKSAPCSLPNHQVAALLGLKESDFLSDPLWIDTGTDQLLIPLKTKEAVHNAIPDSGRLHEWQESSLGRKTAYIFAINEATQSATVRYFFTKQGGGVSEDAGTGSACANLGGWCLATGRQLPIQLHLLQGEHVQRESHLQLTVNFNRSIQVGGNVIELGRGSIQLPQ
jgi:trans-2,3-dihydro-3-hydroxyanthranilate isomerase